MFSGSLLRILKISQTFALVKTLTNLTEETHKCTVIKPKTRLFIPALEKFMDLYGFRLSDIFLKEERGLIQILGLHSCENFGLHAASFMDCLGSIDISMH